MKARAVRLSVIIPTVGRASLAATLESIIGAGIAKHDEVLLVADGGAAEVHHIAEISGLADWCKVRVLDLVPAGGDFGQPGRAFGMASARGTHLVFGQDDNVFMAGALADVRKAAEAEPAHLHFWRVSPRCGSVVWSGQDADGLPMLGHIDADCGVVPRSSAKLGTWGAGYNGDFDFWYETATHYRDRIRWHEEMISCHQR
jgi:hypothetical protein